jgi:hypothetical protein
LSQLSAHDDLLSRKTTTEYGHVRYLLAKTSKVPWTIGQKYYSISSSRALLPKVDKAPCWFCYFLISPAVSLAGFEILAYRGDLSISDLGGWLVIAERRGIVIDSANPDMRQVQLLWE